VERAQTAVASERSCRRHVTAGYRGDRGNATVKELWEEVFSVWSAPSLYNWSPFETFPRCTPVRDLHAAFNLPHVYDYITKLCRQQAEVIQNYDNDYVRGIGQGEARHRKYKRLKLGGGQAYDRSSD
jgi:hypothetical protein